LRDEAEGVALEQALGQSLAPNKGRSENSAKGKVVQILVDASSDI
jgi:hypothetical protein